MFFYFLSIGLITPMIPEHRHPRVLESTRSKPLRTRTAKRVTCFPVNSRRFEAN